MNACNIGIVITNLAGAVLIAGVIYLIYRDWRESKCQK